MWKIRLIKRSKSTESLSNRRIRVGEADEKSKKVPVAPKRTRKPEKPAAPLVPPRPTEKALAKAKRSPTRSRYVELDLSGCHAEQQDARGKDPSSQNYPPVKVKDIKAQTTTVTYAAVNLTQRLPLSSRETLQGAQTMQSSTAQQCATQAASDNSLSSVTVQRSPSLKENKSSSLDDQTERGLSSTLPRAAPRRATVPQVVTSAASNTPVNLRRDRKVTVINSKEAEYKTGTSWVSRTAKSRANRNGASTKSEYYSPEDIHHSRAPRPPSLQVAPTSPLRPPQHAKKSEPPRRPEPPKYKLPKDKLLTQSLPPSPLISRPQKEADIARIADNEYEYIDFEPRRVIAYDASANANLYTDNVIQSGMMNSGDPGIYTALNEMTRQGKSEYDVPSKGLPKTSVSDDPPQDEIYYTTMNPVIPSTPDSVECDDRETNETEEDEYVLPETSVDYVNVPGFQIPTSPESYDSGVSSSQETSTVDESPHIEPEAQGPDEIEPYAEIRRAS